MSTSTLQLFDRDGIELVINTTTGESFATAKGYSRMSGILYDTVKKRCQRGGLENAEIPTVQGLKWGTLISGKVALQWLAKDNPELLAAMAECGWNIYCHKLAGYEITSTAVEPLTVGDMLINMAQAFKKLEDEQILIKQQMALEAQRTDDLEKLVHQHDAEIERYHKPCGDYFSVMGYLRLNQIAPIPLTKAQNIGRKASKLCKELGLPIEPIQDPRYGKINSYPEQILAQVI